MLDKILTSPTMTHWAGSQSNSATDERKKFASGLPTTSAVASDAYSKAATNGPKKTQF